MLDSQGVNSFWDAVSNKETSDYVTRVIVYKEILENPVKYGFDIVIKNKDSNYKKLKDDIVTFHLSLENKKISLKNISTFLGISYREFYLLNPHIKHESYKKTKYIDKYTIIDIFIPKNSEIQLLDSLRFYEYIKSDDDFLVGSHTLNILKDSLNLEHQDYLVYTVNDEKSLGEIAFKYKTSWQKLVEMNKDIKIKKNSNY